MSDTYEDFDRRFLSSVMLTVNSLPNSQKSFKRFSAAMNKALTPYARAVVFMSVRAVRNAADARTNIKEGARPTIEAAANQIRENLRGKPLVHIDLDEMPLVEPIDHSKPFDEAMTALIDKLETDFRRFSKAKDIEGIERMMCAYTAPIGQYVGLTTKSAETATGVINSIIDLMLEMVEKVGDQCGCWWPVAAERGKAA